PKRHAAIACSNWAWGPLLWRSPPPPPPAITASSTAVSSRATAQASRRGSCLQRALAGPPSCCRVGRAQRCLLQPFQLSPSVRPKVPEASSPPPQTAVHLRRRQRRRSSPRATRTRRRCQVSQADLPSPSASRLSAWPRLIDRGGSGDETL